MLVSLAVLIYQQNFATSLLNDDAKCKRVFRGEVTQYPDVAC